MRKKIDQQMSLFDHALDIFMAIAKTDNELKKIDEIIKANPGMIDIVHSDLTDGIQKTGRKGMTAENVLRSAVLKQLKKYPYRELAARINDSPTYRWFTGFRSARIPDFTAFQRTVKSITSESWRSINDILVQYSRDKKLEKGNSIRVDTTVVESNIAYPLDARLLWDSVRVLTRLMKRTRGTIPGILFDFADRTRKTKRLSYKIVMAKGPGAKKKRKKHYRDLIRVTNEVFAMASAFLNTLEKSNHFLVDAVYDEFDHYLTLCAVALDQCERRILNGEKVPADEKIVSIFEEHTDIIVRGKQRKPVEFGHKILVATGRSGIVTQHDVFRGNPGDNTTFPCVLKKHEDQYGRAPWHITGDRRFFSTENEDHAYEKGVKKVAICKPGYRSDERKEFEKKRWFKDLQRFRSGVEGIISGLMRGYGLKRCLWKGWESFRKYVGLCIVSFNLRKIACLM